jgi:4-hydroxy-2-oxoheptanedioate aldolase
MSVESVAGTLRNELRRPRALRGIFVKLPDPAVVEIAAVTQHFIVVDLEHSSLTEGDAIALVRHASALRFPALVRVATSERERINRLLEAGATGIQLSSVESGEDLAKLSSAMRYAPEGTRSISLAHRAARYGAADLGSYVAESAADPPIVVAQLETDLSDELLRDVLDQRPDVGFIGPTDLLVSVGLDRGLLRERLMGYADAITSAGIALGGFRLSDDRVRFDVHHSDLQLLSSGLARTVPQQVG